jgi:hypothetical protein
MTVTRLPDGRFSPGASGNPTGRPRTESAALRAQLAENGPAIAAVVIEAAIGGDLQAAKLVLDRISPPLRAQAAPILLDLPGRPENATSTAAAIIRAAADGDLPPDVAAQLVAAVGTLARIIEVDELKDRLESLERAMKGQRQ